MIYIEQRLETDDAAIIGLTNQYDRSTYTLLS
jgi:hypothetical protein